MISFKAGKFWHRVHSLLYINSVVRLQRQDGLLFDNRVFIDTSQTAENMDSFL